MTTQSAMFEKPNYIIGIIIMVADWSAFSFSWETWPLEAEQPTMHQSLQPLHTRPTPAVPPSSCDTVRLQHI